MPPDDQGVWTKQQIQNLKDYVKSRDQNSSFSFENFEISQFATKKRRQRGFFKEIAAILGKTPIQCKSKVQKLQRNERREALLRFKGLPPDQRPYYSHSSHKDMDLNVNHSLIHKENALQKHWLRSLDLQRSQYLYTYLFSDSAIQFLTLFFQLL